VTSLVVIGITALVVVTTVVDYKKVFINCLLITDEVTRSRQD